MDNSFFKKLPAELRNRVYALALNADDNEEKKTDISDWKEDTSLLRVCRQVRSEASSYYYSDRDFYYLVSAGDGNHAKWDALSDWVGMIGQTNASDIRSLEIDYDLSRDLEIYYTKYPRRLGQTGPMPREHTLEHFAPLTIEILRTLDEMKAGGLVPGVVFGTSYPTFVDRIKSVIGPPSGATAPFITRLSFTIEEWVEEEAELALVLASPVPGARMMRPRLKISERPRLKEYWSVQLKERLRARALELAGVELRGELGQLEKGRLRGLF